LVSWKKKSSAIRGAKGRKEKKRQSNISRRTYKLGEKKKDMKQKGGRDMTR